MQRDLNQAMDHRCKTISVRVTSSDKTVSVQVDGLGSMTGLWLGDNAYRNGPEALAQMIIDTAAVAAKVASDRQQYLLKEFYERLAKLQQASLTRYDRSAFQPRPTTDD